jgi:gluconolactonase
MRIHPPKLTLALLLVAAGCSSGGGSPDAGTGGSGTTGTAGHGGTTGTAGNGTGGGPGTGGGQGGAVGGSGGAGTSGTGGSVGAAGTGVVGSGGGGASGGAGRGGATAGTGGASAGTGGTSVAGSGGGAGRGGAGGRGGTGGSATGGSGGGTARWTCPTGNFTTPSPSSISLTKVAGVPPFDSFNNNGNNFGNIEGAVWFGDALYVSEISSQPNPPASRILRVPTTGAPSIAFPNSGTNGLAIDIMGRLMGANHVAGGVFVYDLTNMTSTPIVSTYMGKRFDSPNDLTMRSDGTLYFSDPDFQAPSPAPQSARRLYRLPPGATEPMVVDANRSNPNGVTLSLDEAFLYVTDGQGLWRYPVNADGSTGTATQIAQSAVNSSGDGMGIDCAGTLYVATQQKVVLVNPTGNGTSPGSITLSGVQSVTNIAFGGANHQTLYVTGLGNGMGGTAMGLYRADMPLPGMPF